MQALLFAALLANARAHVDGDPFFAPVAGALLGLLLFLRFDVVLGIMGVAAGLALGAFSGQRARPSFVATFVVVAGAAVAYLLGPLRAYAAGPILFLQTLPTWESWALIMVALTALALLALSWRLPEGIKALGPWVPIAIVAGTWVLAVYALIFRHQAGKLAIHDAEALRTFTNWYFTLPALIAALIGLALLSRRFFRDPALISTVVIFACFLFYKIRIVPNHFWMTRRFLPVILPGALIFASTAVLSGVRLPRTLTGSTRTALRVLFIVLLAGYYVRVSRPVVQHTEYSGLIPKLEQLAKTIGDDDLVIAESRDTGSDVHVLALPLAYIYGRNVLVLYQVKPDKANLAAFLEWARTRYRRVLFIGGGGTDLLSKRYGVRAVASERFQVPEYDSPLNAFPRFVRQKEFEYGVYEFTDPDTSAADRDFDFDVGVGDDLNVVRFHAKETSEGHTFRWTGPTSYLSITHIRPSNRELVLWLSNGGRPPAADPADLSVFLQNQLLGTVRVGNGFTPYVFPIPADLAKQASATGEPVELRLVTRTWNPHKVLGTPDDRNIGVMVIPNFVRQALAGQPITVFGDGTQSRSFTYVGDVVKAMVALIDEPRAIGQVFNIGNGEEISIRDLAQKVKQLTGSDSEIVTVPYEKAYEAGFEDMLPAPPAGQPNPYGPPPVPGTVVPNTPGSIPPPFVRPGGPGGPGGEPE